MNEAVKPRDAQNPFKEPEPPPLTKQALQQVIQKEIDHSVELAIEPLVDTLNRTKQDAEMVAGLLAADQIKHDKKVQIRNEYRQQLSKLRTRKEQFMLHMNEHTKAIEKNTLQLKENDKINSDLTHQVTVSEKELGQANEHLDNLVTVLSALEKQQSREKKHKIQRKKSSESLRKVKHYLQREIIENAEHVKAAQMVVDETKLSVTLLKKKLLEETRKVNDTKLQVEQLRITTIQLDKQMKIELEQQGLRNSSTGSSGNSGSSGSWVVACGCGYTAVAHEQRCIMTSISLGLDTFRVLFTRHEMFEDLSLSMSVARSLVPEENRAASRPTYRTVQSDCSALLDPSIKRMWITGETGKLRRKQAFRYWYRRPIVRLVWHREKYARVGHNGLGNNPDRYILH